MNGKKPSVDGFNKVLEENEELKNISDGFTKCYNEDERFRKLVDEWNSIGCQSFSTIEFENSSKITTIDSEDSPYELSELNIDEVFELILFSMNDYMESEGYTKEVSKVKAIEEFTMWFYGNKEKELTLRKKLSEV